jgi:hypothetical protein
MKIDSNMVPVFYRRRDDNKWTGLIFITPQQVAKIPEEDLDTENLFYLWTNPNPPVTKGLIS